MAANPPVLSSASARARTTTRRAARSIAWPVLDYIGISLLIMLPLWPPGYILVMDAVFVPHYRFEAASVPSLQPVVTALAVLNLVVPSDIIEKLIFTAIIVLAGLGMHRLVVTRFTAVRYLAGLLAVFNPFVYDRFMYGQWGVLLGYALLPWLLASARNAAASPVRWPVWPAFRVAMLWTLIAVLSLPLGLVAAAAVAIMLCAAFIFGEPAARRGTVWLGAFIALWCVALNIYWIVPSIAGSGGAVTQAARFSPLELAAFATQSDQTWGSMLTVLGGYGFWAEGSTRFIDLRSAVAYWPLEPIALLGLAVFGLWAIRRKRGEWATAIGLSICLVVGVGLAIGVASPPTEAVTRFLFAHSALYHGLRDTQKWTALSMVAGIALAARGLDRALAYLGKFRRGAIRPVAASFLIVPFLFAPALVWGFEGQLSPVDYPSSWFDANARLRADHSHFSTLFLPWHEYLRFPFAGHIIATPARAFFDVPVIQGDNLEMQRIYSDSVNPVSAALDSIVATYPVDTGKMAGALARYHIKYVLLARTADWRDYRYLDKSPGIRLVTAWPDLLLYRNLVYRNLAWHH